MLQLFLKSNSQNGIGETNQTFFMQEIEARTYVTNIFNMQIHDTDLKQLGYKKRTCLRKNRKMSVFCLTPCLK